ncbi:lytic murein transglycosylase [Micromonospora maritima]
MGDTRRVVDGERRNTARPLRPAAPPDGGAGPVPRPRRASSGSPTPEKAPSTPESADGSAGPGAATGAEEPGTGGRRRRMPFAHAGPVRPRQLAAGAARATRAWSRRPSGRTTLPALFLLALVGAATTAGAVLVPAAVRKPEPVAVEATSAAPVLGVPQTGPVPGLTGAPVLPGSTGLPGTPGPSGTPLPGGVTTAPALPSGRPADALAGWAQRVGGTTDVPAVALQAYGYAELVLAQTHRSCQLSWTTLAAIGYVESRHGTTGGVTLLPNGLTSREIRGDALDGQGGRSRILDTDQGQLDGDRTYDRAIGPMQFIPGTWQEIGADADNDGVKNPHDIDDAALAAGEYLCKGGRNMTIPGDWWGAILSYNDVRRYAQDVFTKADEYGRRSGT